jgi:hypothetical protein
MWEVECLKCGRHKPIALGDLRTPGKLKTCGCGKLKDLKGKQFERLTVIERAPSMKGRSRWKVKCKCGEVKTVDQSALHKGLKSCNCLAREKARENVAALQQARRAQTAHSLEGLRLKYATVVERKGFKNGQSIWRAICDCGNEFEATGAKLKFGSKKTCGCKNGLTPERTMRNELYKSCSAQAKRRKLSWEISDLDFDRLSKENCHYCGIEPSGVWARPRRGSYAYTGLDRRDNKIGYTATNVLPCCKDCNYAKKSLPYAEFQDWMTQLVRVYGERVRSGGTLEPSSLL